MNIPATLCANWFDFAGWDVGAVLLVLMSLWALHWFARTLTARLLLGTFATVVVRLRVLDRAHVPRTGPVLLVCNHVSYLDWLLVWVACPRRVRFVAWAKYWQNPMLRYWLNWAQAIPLDPPASRRGLLLAVAALRAGECVCLFPEGRLTRTGHLQPFQRGLELLLRRCPAPVVPVFLDRLRGSILSHTQHKPSLLRWPPVWFRRVIAAFGPPLPPTTDAVAAQEAVRLLSVTCAQRGRADVLPVQRQFLRIARTQPFQTALIDTTATPPRTLSYGRTVAGALCLADWLRSRLGTQPLVGVWLPQSVGGVLANLALHFLGKTPINLNYTAGPEAIQSACQQTGLQFVLSSKRFLSKAPLVIGTGTAAPTVILLEEALAGITNQQRTRTFLFALLCPIWLLERWYGLHRHQLDDLGTMVFSSGSTGLPKGVMLSQRNLAANVESMISTLALTRRDRLLGVLPFFHSFGYTVTLWAPLLARASAVYHPDPRQAVEVGQTCKTHGATILLATATFLRFYLKRCQDDDFRSLRLLICGAEKLPLSLADECARKFGVVALEGYGCTELSPVVSTNVPDVLEADFCQVGTKRGSVGMPLPGIAVKTVHPETYADQPPGTDGLVLVTGANVMLGYWQQPELTARVLRNGWYVTGDMGRFDPDGFLTLTGRLARFAKLAGEMVPLERVEDELHLAAGVTERLCAVTAVPDVRKGERVIVLHLALPGELTVSAWLDQLSTRGLPNLWLPNVRDCVWVDELPLLGSGKLDLQRVKQMAIERTQKEE
jgi:acyl-[acyl-carrier-protein]-phospholipid O-acyltransferase/long-chain-fatty-acid--[acyl-carrier-protein] ligase